MFIIICGRSIKPAELFDLQKNYVQTLYIIYNFVILSGELKKLQLIV